ncbi:MAG: DUF3999 family protein [Deltaproteobacteria bacterium]|nr:DUF3999 family protein [Deltaproteobacteria bacterium]
MNRLFCCILCTLLSLLGTAGLCTTFDERLWERYAEIETSQGGYPGSLMGIYLGPQQLGDVHAKTSFADLRVMTDQKEEVPWQMVSRRPAKRQEAIPHRMQNLSTTEKGETWLELLVDRQEARVNAVEVVTPDTDFSRQVQVLGSSDGQNWNTLRKDGVIFDFPRIEKLRHTRITFPPAGFRYIAIKINNGGAPPLTVSDVRLWQESDSRGQTYMIQGTIEKSERNVDRKESSIVVCMNAVFPLDRLTITTPERNFQRSVEVQVKRGKGNWEWWARGTIFSFDTETMHESQLAIDMPEIATKEFRLIFKNLDSPSLPVTGVTGKGYRRLLVFKQQADRKLYLFWGNPLAQQPRFDLDEIVAKQKLDELPMAYLGQARANSAFAGDKARLPFTERYKYLLYIVVILAIAILIFLQYRVIRRVDS